MQQKHFRADIQGLRAIAVMAVIFYHFGLIECTGGYIGVDIFFVISGYLITLIINRESDLGQFSFADFYQRRIRRIFPALAVVLFLCGVAAYLLMPPAQMKVFAETLAASALFGSNFYFLKAYAAAGYFGDEAQANILLHIWSLSIEEQFYVSYPLLLSGFIAMRRELATKVMVTALLAASFASSIYYMNTDPREAFYLPQSRAWEFLAGASIALGLIPRLKTFVAEAGSLVGLGLIIFAAFYFTSDTPYPGWNALIPVFGSALIIHCGSTSNFFVQRLLSIRPLVFLGTISYSLYLLHWPVIFVFKEMTPYAVKGNEAWFAVLLSVSLATLSYHFIEGPFLQRKTIATFVPLPTAVLALAIFGLVGAITQGLPQRFQQRRLQ